MIHMSADLTGWMMTTMVAGDASWDRLSPHAGAGDNQDRGRPRLQESPHNSATLGAIDVPRTIR